MATNQVIPPPISLEECLKAYRQIVDQFGFSPEIRPGRIQLLGWDIEYVYAPELAIFIDQILVRRLNDFIPDNERPLILDCGANVGFSVLNYKRQFPACRITAFEPDPAFVPILRRNLVRNHADDVQVVEAAAWTADGQASWLCEGIDGSRVAEDDADGDKVVSVPTVDLGRYLDKPVDLLKLDIEGGEYAVIAHLGQRLRNVKNILVECHLDQSKIIPFGQLLADLTNAGFKLSINTFGAWRDLIRQVPVPPMHWEQYVLVAGWRANVSAASEKESVMPYIGAQDELRRRAGEMQLLDILRAYLAFDGKHIERRTLTAPFTREGTLGWFAQLPDVVAESDSENARTRSVLMLFENVQPLWPAHSLHEDIRNFGGGRFSHWGDGLRFSTSDGSDPNTNGRAYTIAFPDPEKQSASLGSLSWLARLADKLGSG